MLIHAGEYECIINVQMYIKQIEKLKNSLLKLFLNYIRETLFGAFCPAYVLRNKLWDKNVYPADALPLSCREIALL